MKKKIGILCLLVCLAPLVYAEQTLKEETTPPSPEGALTTKDIPPLYSAVNATKQPEQVVAPQQQTMPTTPAPVPASPPIPPPPSSTQALP